MSPISIQNIKESLSISPIPSVVLHSYIDPEDGCCARHISLCLEVKVMPENFQVVTEYVIKWGKVEDEDVHETRYYMLNTALKHYNSLLSFLDN